MKSFVRKHLCITGLLSRIKSQYIKIEDNRKSNQFPLVDCLMTGIAMFGLKYPSLLQFDQDTRNNERVQHNLKSLYQTPVRSYLDIEKRG